MAAKEPTDQDLWNLAFRTAGPRVGWDGDLAGNAAGDTIRKLVRWRDDLDPGAVKAWVRVVARNEATEQLKRKRPPIPVGFRGSEPPPGPPAPRRGDDDPDAGGGTRAGKAEHAAEVIRSGGPSLGSLVADRVVLRDALGFLDDQLRRIVEMRYFGKSNSTEIGRELGIPAPTVRKRLAEARDLLRIILGGAIDDLVG